MTNTNTIEKWPMYLAGQACLRSSAQEVWDPGTGAVIATVPSASRADALHAVDIAEAGAKIARRLPTSERMGILQRAAERLFSHSDDASILIARESSKTIREARKEVGRCVDTLRLSAEEARRIGGQTIRFDQAEGSAGRKGYWERGPVGIITAITPFNDPLNLVAHKLGPAIATGNAVILKPSNETPLSALYLAQILYDVGLPREMLSVITGQANEIGEVLIADPRIRMISFTGGLKTGTHIAHQAGLKKLAMELGSNSPVIILQDADLERAVEATVSGGFWAAGQNCLGVQRVFIEEVVYESVKERIMERTASIRVGNKLDEHTDMGPLINERESRRVEAWVEEAQIEGARILVGGHREGSFYAPTILDQVPSHARVLKEEIFGPVMSLIPVRDLSEAIHGANRVNYGLQAGVFTQNIQKAFRAIEELDMGGVMINDSSDYRIDAMPFGGVKGSGLGREGVPFTAEAMTEPKVVCFNL